MDNIIERYEIMDIIKTLEQEFKIKRQDLDNVVELLDQGNTIPFIARYRKEMTGSMTDVTLRELSNRLTYMRNLENRKEEVIKLISQQDKLTKEIENEITKATSLQKIDDIYRPFRPKRRTRATIAKEKGLQGLAQIIMDQNLGQEEFISLAEDYIDIEKDVNSLDQAIEYAKDIIAEEISDKAEHREIIRNILYKSGFISTSGLDKEKDSVYKMYYDYSEKISTIANHRILAMNRGEKEKILRVAIRSEDKIEEILARKIIKNQGYTGKIFEEAIYDGYKRLAFPSIEREIRNNLTERAEEDAIKVFSKNLKPLILQSPLRSKRILGMDPGFRTGCKVAAVDNEGNLLDYATIYPTEPRNQVEKSTSIVSDLMKKHDIDVIAIGNGTASRETELFVVNMLEESKSHVKYSIVSEAGASIYSASELGSQEFPDLDVSIRGAISIARRLQDPMAELVKIEPRHIGVGQYQHDLNKKKLDEALRGVVEDCVNSVGVNLNTASESLLKYVAGISSRLAKNVIEFRREEGGFTNRKQLSKVKGLGKKTFEQCAGFLRIPNGEEFLDNTGVHPESYSVAKEIIGLDYKKIDVRTHSENLGVGISTLEDIIKDLVKPGRDLREEMEKPILKSNILKVDDLEAGMTLNGTVRNVVDFGAFVDIGVGIDGLVHISQISEKFVKDIMGEINVGEIVQVRVLDIDPNRNRISLSMRK